MGAEIGCGVRFGFYYTKKRRVIQAFEYRKDFTLESSNDTYVKLN